MIVLTEGSFRVKSTGILGLLSDFDETWLFVVPMVLTTLTNF